MVVRETDSNEILLRHAYNPKLYDIYLDSMPESFAHGHIIMCGLLEQHTLAFEWVAVDGDVDEGS